MKSLRPQCEPADLIAEAERRTGECRARAIIRAYRETAEWLYDPYLRTLWVLTCLARNEWQPEPKKFGDIVVQLSRKLKNYPGLVEEDAGWRRNAAAHGPNWEYVEKDDSINMRDERHPWSNISVDHLYSKVLSMYWIAGPTLVRVGQFYMLRNVISNTGLADTFIGNFPRFLSSDEVERQTAEQEMTEKAKNVFGPLQSLLNTGGQPPVVSGV